MDPFQVFHLRKTPIGLYARQKWLGEGKTASWHSDFNQTVASLKKGQSRNGSWGNSRISTIRHLFALHLTVREPTSAVNAGLDWLTTSILSPISSCEDYPREQITIESLRELPFSPGHYNILMITSTIFLATVFGRGNDDLIIAAYNQLDQECIRKDGYLCGWKCLGNVLRAFVVHDKYSASRSTELLVRALRAIQNPKGNWENDVPFYRTLNALAHLNTLMANSQFELALRRLYKTQSRDGSWGKVEPELSTFLVVHALKRKGLL